MYVTWMTTTSITSEKYQVYGLPALESGNGFTNAQCSCQSASTVWLKLTNCFFIMIALLNVIETLLNITYLYLAHVAQWPPATLIGLGAAVMTLSKTVLYWAQEYYCGFCAVGHNNASDLFFLWVIPNGYAHLISCPCFSFLCRSLNPHLASGLLCRHSLSHGLEKTWPTLSILLLSSPRK